MFKSHLFIVAALIVVGDLWARIPLARSGQPVAEIVLPADAPPPATRTTCGASALRTATPCGPAAPP